MKIDLGCGSDKHADCTGIDIKPGASVDLVHDFGQSIPLLENAVTFVMANRSLEYAHDLMAVMREIYRVCQHKALVCIVAPYSQAALHVANPAVRTYFNEYTPFYLASKDYHGDLKAALGFSPHYIPEEAPELQFRLLRMELFYFPNYLESAYEDQDRDELRQSLFNVADEIMYHFVVIKEELSNLDCCVLAAGELEEPERITKRRRVEHSAAASGEKTREALDNPVYVDPADEEPAEIPVKPPSAAPQPGRQPVSSDRRKGAYKMKKSKRRNRLIRVKSVARQAKERIPLLRRSWPVSRILFDIRDLYMGAAWRTKRKTAEETKEAEGFQNSGQAAE
ncbi:methyltransferase domain-containing protein [Paenibacillus lemnae]|uniref:Class I SAM-dependent methyltransferase n=1 Tax=Paenibacillus lemnae TaxID=1330551 RepID=A0A848M0R3_PAELE|nr:methyltransferase domain-containing protein [Paenibacillus lemnae]NMO94427.1 class I SAM-dependent methyltransferase [Paenibacillus lemnae]